DVSHPVQQKGEQRRDEGPAESPTHGKPQEIVIQASDLRMRYGQRDVLDGVGLRIRRGELFGLLRPNGAGKSTIIEILESYRRRSAGQVAVLGQDPETGDAAWPRLRHSSVTSGSQ
ncbi:ATP-binding cassette domain-containing protein, partial [Streptomyces mirabilis]|uniref:ATP-binding cassette domain-containing protein n=1 Tax=Streptomyces mirabilis TaxID=68239 RepID=UPI0036905AEC